MGKVISLDGLRSFISGLGDPLRDKAASALYERRLLDDRQLLDSYQSSWIARKLVDIPAYDALKKWRIWRGHDDQVQMIQALEGELGLQDKLLQCKIQARLWGGAAIYIGTGQPPSQPLRPQTIAKGDLQYLSVFSRKQLNAGPLQTDPFSEDYGKPAYYQIASEENCRIHPSRLVLQIGVPHPDPWAVGVNCGWGDSVLQAAYQAVSNVDAIAANIASLVFEANVDVFGVPDLMSSLADEQYEQRLLDRFTLAATGKSINRALIRDAGETYERNQVSFTGLPEIMQQFMLMVAGAADIPATRFLGQSPAGLNATGESDMKNYHDKIRAMQSLELQTAMRRLDQTLVRSALGDYPPQITYSWAPLADTDDSDRARLGKLVAETTEILAGSGTFSKRELREAAASQLKNIFPALEASMQRGVGGKRKS